MSYRTLAKNILRQYDLSPKKYLSQNFLVDAKVYPKIITAAAIRPHEQVVEVGPGLGFLTSALLDAGAQVSAIELDPALVEVMQRLVPVSPGLKLFHADFLDIDLDTWEGIDHDQSYKVVANIPYHITARIIRRCMTLKHRPDKVVLLIQKEVAERICASAGQHSKLSLAVQLYGTPEIVTIVSRHAFYPVPKVDSAIVSIAVTSISLSAELEKLIWRMVTIGFGAKRKKLVSTLAAGLYRDKRDILACIEQSGIRVDARPQHVSVEQWIELAKQVGKIIE